MDRIRVYTGGVASCNGYLFKTRDNAYVAVDAPSGFADWIYSKSPISLSRIFSSPTSILTMWRMPAACARFSTAAFMPGNLTMKA